MSERNEVNKTPIEETPTIYLVGYDQRQRAFRLRNKATVGEQYVLPAAGRRPEIPLEALQSYLISPSIFVYPVIDIRHPAAGNNSNN